MSYGGGNDYQSYGASGGGFYTGSQAGGGSQTTPGSEAKGRGSNTLRPVTIKQILEATQDLAESPHKIDGIEISHITFIGRVRSVAEQTTNITYVIDDGTGTVDVKQWVDAEAAAESGAAQQMNGQYVRILGQLKSFGNKKHVGSHKIHAVTDFNEVAYHLLEATLVHLQLTRGPPPDHTGGAATSAYGQQARSGGDVVMGGTGGDVGGPSHNLPSEASRDARLVFNAIKAASDSAEGIHYSVIKNKSQLSMDVVNSAVEELLGLGAVYTTMDEFHVAAMEF